MLLHNLFHLCTSEPIFLAENSFSDQRGSLLTEEYLLKFENIGGDAARKGGALQLTDHGIPIAIAVYVHSQGFDHWLVLTNVISKDERFSKRVSDIFSGSDVIETSAPDLRDAVIEYYSIFLTKQWLCESCAREDMPYLDLGVFVAVRELLNGGGGGEPNSEPDERGERLSCIFREIRRRIGLNSSCMGGRQPMPAETHVAPDEYIRITKQMRRRQCRADAIQVAGRGGGGMYYW